MPAFEAELLKAVPRTLDISSFRFSNPMDIAYKAGQYLSITINEGGKALIHYFSISSSPTEKGYLEFTTRLRDTEFKNALRKLEIGDKVYLKAPFGDFVLDDATGRIGMLSGGIGIAPLRSMIRYCTDKRLGTKIVLLYGNRSERDIVFKDELEDMQRENPNLKVVHTLAEAGEDWKGYRGYIDAAMVKKEIPDYEERVFYSCGPPAMVEAMEGLLVKMGVKKENIREENFSGY